jgi:hypothetical protein
MFKFFNYIIVLILFLTFSAKSQEITATLTNDTNNVLIGEQIKLKIDVNFKNVKNIVFPIFADTIGKLEIVELFPVDTVRVNNKIESLSKKFIVTCFDSGSYETMPFVISYETIIDSNIRITQTNSLTLNFSTIQVDTNQSSLKDIKPPIQIPFGFDDLLPYIGIVLLVSIMYYVVIYVFGKKRVKNDKTMPKYDPRIPADLEAIEQLQRLERENVWQRGDYKQYHSRLTDILRVYIHRRYHLNALEMTSGELIEELNRYEQNVNAMNVISNILNVADLAKFAKYEPSVEENVNSMKNAFIYINLTKVLDITEEEMNISDEGGNQ